MRLDRTVCTQPGQSGVIRLASLGEKLSPMRRASASSETSVITYQAVLPPTFVRWRGSRAKFWRRSTRIALFSVWRSSGKVAGSLRAPGLSVE